MKAFNTTQYEKYQSEVREKWGKTDAYKEHAERTENYSEQKWNDLAGEMDRIMAAFATCMKKGENPSSAESQELVQSLQSHITDRYYLCTNEILSGLGQMYVCDERFKDNIDKHGAGTAEFICKAIQIYCGK